MLARMLTRRAHRWLRKHKVLTVILAIVAFLLVQLPPYVADVWSLASDRPLATVLTEQLSGFQFSVGWVTTPIAFAMLLTIIVLLLTGGREKEDTQPSQSVEDLNAEHAKEIKKLSDRIEELEDQKAALESRWNTHVFQYSWLFGKAQAQGQSISSYVEVEKVYFCYQELETPMLKSVFGIDYRNQSVFDISIEKTVSGHIEFEGTKLDATPLIVNDLGTVGIGGKGTITIEQRLTRPEADLIASKDPKYIEFNLTNLVITIKGEHFTPNEPQYLKIPKRLHTDPQAEIALLKSEIVDAKKRLEIIPTLQAQIAEYKQQQEPKVDIIYKNEPPYLEVLPHGKERRIEVYIGVKSKIAINDLRVELESDLRVKAPIMYTRNEQPYPLCEKDDEPPYKRAFSLAAGEEKLFHVITVIEPNGPYTFHTVDLIPENPAFHELSIVARASNTLPCRKHVNLRYRNPMKGYPFSFGLSDYCS